VHINDEIIFFGKAYILLLKDIFDLFSKLAKHYIHCKAYDQIVREEDEKSTLL
jgi:hypothetical protein